MSESSKDLPTGDEAANDAVANDAGMNDAVANGAAETQVVPSAHVEQPVVDLDALAADAIPTDAIPTPALPIEPEPVRPATQVFSDDDFRALDAAAESQAYSAEPPVVRTSPSGSRKRRGWRTAALITTAVLLLTVIVGVGTELYVRHKVTSCLQNAFTDLTGTSTSVSVPRGPLLLSWVNGNIEWVQVDTNDSPTGGAMRLHARASDISRDGRTVQKLEGKAFVPFERIRELTTQQGGDAPAVIESITGNGKSGTLTIESNYPVVFLSVPATVVLEPMVVGGKIEFQVKEAKAFGIGLPSDFAQQLVDQVSGSMLGPLFEEIQVRDLKTTDTGVEFSFSGDDVNMQAATVPTAAPSGTQAPAPSSCA